LNHGIISNLVTGIPNPSSNFAPYIQGDGMAYTILPWVQELFDSNATIFSPGFSGSNLSELSMAGFIANEYLQAPDNMLDELNFFLTKETCRGITWNDPTAKIINVVEDLAFRLVLFSGNESINDNGFYNGPGGFHQDIQATQILLEPVYRVNWAYLWMALAVIIFATASVMPTFYGWWELGRNVSFSPLEIAKAFNAPILMDVPSNRDIDAMLKELDGVKVRYGERSVHTSNGMDYGRALPTKLEMADPKLVFHPRPRHRYNG
jgi:hypothetical protein